MEIYASMGAKKITQGGLCMAYIQSHKWQPWLLPPIIEDLIPEDRICF
jgi:hypothetical protein